MKRLHHLVRYLHGRRDEKRILKVDPDDHTIRIQTDSNWAGCILTSRSTDCVVMRIHGMLISVAVKTQTQ
eukprot:2628120-Alexandrium_andersonii.AAC.1